MLSTERLQSVIKDSWLDKKEGKTRRKPTQRPGRPRRVILDNFGSVSALREERERSQHFLKMYWELHTSRVIIKFQ